MNVTEIIDDNKLLCNCTNDDDDFMTIEISPIFFNNITHTMCFINNMLPIIFIV